LVDLRGERSRGLAIAAVALALVLVSACETPAQRQAQENARIEKEAAKEISRVCALPQDKRETELKRINQQSGVEVYCGYQ
jgi:hypothetical protein